MQQKQNINQQPSSNPQTSNDRIKEYYRSLRRGMHLIQSNQLIMLFCKEVDICHIFETEQKPINYVDLTHFKNVTQVKACICDLIDFHVAQTIAHKDKKQLIQNLNYFQNETIEDKPHKKLCLPYEKQENFQGLLIKHNQFRFNRIYTLSFSRENVYQQSTIFSNVADLFNLLTNSQMVQANELSEIQVKQLLSDIDRKKLIDSISEFYLKCNQTIQRLNQSSQNANQQFQQYKNDQINLLIQNVMNLRNTIRNYMSPCFRMNIMIQQNNVLKNFNLFKSNNLLFFLNSLLFKFPIFIAVLQEIEIRKIKQIIPKQDQKEYYNKIADRFQDSVAKRIRECSQISTANTVVASISIQGFKPDQSMQMITLWQFIYILNQFQIKLNGNPVPSLDKFQDILNDMKSNFKFTYEFFIAIQIEFRSDWEALQFKVKFNSDYWQHDFQNEFVWNGNNLRVTSFRPLYSDNLASTNLLDVMCMCQFQEQYVYLSDPNILPQQKIKRIKQLQKELIQRIDKIKLKKGRNQEQFESIMKQFMSSGNNIQGLLSCYDNYIQYMQQYNKFQVFNTSAITYKNVLSPQELDYLEREQCCFTNIQIFPIVQKVKNAQYNESQQKYKKLFYFYDQMNLKPQIYFKQQLCDLLQCKQIMTMQSIEINNQQLENPYEFDLKRKLKEKRKLINLEKIRDQFGRGLINTIYLYTPHEQEQHREQFNDLELEENYEDNYEDHHDGQ